MQGSQMAAAVNALQSASQTQSASAVAPTAPAGTSLMLVPVKAKVGTVTVARAAVTNTLRKACVPEKAKQRQTWIGIGVVLVTLAAASTIAAVLSAGDTKIRKSAGIRKFVLGMLNESAVTKYVLRNSKGMEVDLISVGARVNAIRIPQEGDQMIDVAIGTDESNVTNFLKNIFGSVNGKVCSRVHPRFTYNNVSYRLDKGQVTEFYNVDGGGDGFFKKNYDVNYVVNNTVHFILNSTENETGTPMAYSVHAVYELTTDNQLRVSMSFVSEVTTPLDICSSISFNLAGERYGILKGHELQIFSTGDDVVDAGGGQYESTIPPIDYRARKSFDALLYLMRMTSQNYDYSFWGWNDTSVNLMATVYHPISKITLDVYSNMPVLRFLVLRIHPGKSIAGKSGGYTGSPMFLAQPQKYPVTHDIDVRRLMDRLMHSSGSEYKKQTIYKFTY